MSDNILKKILDNKKNKINNLKKDISLESLSEKIKDNDCFINFKEKIINNYNNDKISIIAEIKKASPSAGIIINDYNPVEIASIYKSNKATRFFYCQRMRKIYIYVLPRLKEKECQIMVKR